MTLKNNRTPLLSPIKFCASFHHHMWIQSWVTVRKWLNWVFTSVTLTFDLWPWPFAWTSLLSLVFTFWKFYDDTMMGTLWKSCDRQTDGRTDRSVLRAALCHCSMDVSWLHDIVPSKIKTNLNCHCQLTCDDWGIPNTKLKYCQCTSAALLCCNKANLRDLKAATGL